MGNQIVVQLEELRLGPDVGGVHGHVDGQIADDADALLVDVVAQSGPLPEKQKLQIGEELHILPQKCAVLVQHGLVLTKAKVVVGP